MQQFQSSRCALVREEVVVASSLARHEDGVSALAEIFETLCVQRMQQILLQNSAITFIDALTCVRCRTDTAPCRLFRFCDATLCVSCYRWLMRDESPRTCSMADRFVELVTG